MMAPARDVQASADAGIGEASLALTEVRGAGE